MSYTPEQILSREFAMAADGYDPVEVRAFLRDLAERPPAATDFSSVGEEISRLLLTAHEAVEGLRERTAAEAARVTATAERAAAEILDQARSEAAELHAAAASDRAEAERIEETSRTKAEAIVVAAASDAREVVERAEESARRRLADVEDRLRAELDRLLTSEREAIDYMLAAWGALESAVTELCDNGQPDESRGE